MVSAHKTTTPTGKKEVHFHIEKDTLVRLNFTNKDEKDLLNLKDNNLYSFQGTNQELSIPLENIYKVELSKDICKIYLDKPVHLHGENNRDLVYIIWIEDKTSANEFWKLYHEYKK